MMMSSKLSPALRCLRSIVVSMGLPLLAAFAAAGGQAVESRMAPAPVYEVYAIRYATIAGFPLRGLVAGADSGKRTDIAMMVWLAKAAGHTVLLDAGFHNEKFIRQWKPADYIRPDSAVARAGVRPEDVTDVVLSHIHWDHMDGVDLFPRARVWVQREEYAYYVGADGRALHPGIDSVDAAQLASLNRAGRLTLVDGDGRELMPGVTAYTGGRHTYASQYVTVNTAAGTVVLASDNVYLYQNLDQHVPIAQTFDARSNLAAQDRMRQLASSPRLIVPGHDPAVFARFPSAGPSVVRIQ